LLYIHPYLNDESAQGEIIRVYAKCHIVASKDIAWEGLWIFGKALNDTELLEIFALKLLDVNAIEATEKIIQHIKYIEPYSECLTRLQTKLSRQKAIDSLKSEGIKFENIQSLSGIEFEELVQLRFERFQLKTTQTPVSGDFGADLIVEDDDGTIYVIQCKRFARKVNLKAVQEVVAAKRHYGGDYGIVITNNEFLNSAIELAKSNQIELWNGDKLLKFLSGDLSFSTLFDGMPQLAASTRPSLED
jgi:restriction system protein